MRTKEISEPTGAPARDERVRFLAVAFRRILLVVLLIFVFAIVQMFTLWAVCGTGMKTAQLLEHEGLPSLNELASLQENLASYRLHSYEYLFAQKEDRAARKKDAETDAEQIRLELKTILTLFPEGEGRQLAASLEMAVDDLDAEFRMVRDLTDSDFNAAMNVMDREIPPRSERVGAAAQALKDFGYRFSGGQASATFGSFGWIKTNAVLFGVGNIVVAFGAMMFVLVAARRSRAQVSEALARLDERTRELQDSNAVLHLKETELQMMFDFLPAILCFKNTENRFLRVNQRLADSLGKSVAELEGKTGAEIYPHDAAKFYEDDSEVIRSGAAKLGIIETFQDKENKITWVQTDKIPVSDRAGKIIGLMVMCQDITERKRAEVELQWKTAFLEAQVSSSFDGILVVDPQSRKILQSQRFNDLFKIPQHIAEDKDDEKQLRWVTDRMKNPEPFAEKVAYLYSHSDEISRDEIEMKDGTILDRYSSPVTGKDGKHYGRIWTLRDITERRHAEKMLHDSEARFSRAFEFAPNGIALVAPDGRWLKVNRALCDLLGYSEAELLKLTFQEITDPADLPDCLTNVGRLFAGEIALYENEKSYVHKRGHLVPVSFSLSLLRNAAGQPLHLIAQIQDITERRRAETLLIQSEQRLALAKESAHIGIWDWNLVANVLSWDTRMYELYGIREQDFSGAYEAWQKGLHPEDRARGDAAIHAALDGVEDFNIEFRVLWPNGEVRYVEGRAMVQRAGNGSPTRMIGVNWDITARKLAELESERLRNENRAVLDSLGEGVHWIDLDGRIKFENPAAAKMLGYEAADLIGKPAHATMHHHRADGTPYPVGECNIYATLRDAKTRQIFNEVFWRKDGTSFPVEYTSTPILDEHGILAGAVVVFTDITERKRLEEQLIQSQRMESIGKLAGGIAHEFNSLLTAILGQCEMLLTELADGSPLRENATEINQAAGRAAGLTRQLLAYGRKQFLNPELLNLNRVMENMQGVFGSLLGGVVDLQIIPAPRLGVVRADAGQVEQVILNLVINAREAMPSGGKLTLETANVTLDEEYLSGRPALEMKAGRYVLLAVTDTGVGMNETVKARLFEPFFSTKRVGEGAGLGLSTCYGIVKQSGGHISVYSELARGTTFKIYLPQVESAALPKPLPRLNSRDLPRGTETILLVEDDAALRVMATSLLQRLGYTVMAAASGREALNVKQQSGTAHIDLLFTDLVMPHMDGKELADRVRLISPQIKILFTSAYTENSIAHQGALEPGALLLQKPYTPAVLAHKLRAVLDETAVNQSQSDKTQN